MTLQAGPRLAAGGHQSFAARCGLHDAPREAAIESVLRTVREQPIQRVSVGWCDLHGALRSKAVLPHALADALHAGLGMVSTLMLKDTSERTAFKVFEPGALAGLPGFGAANNLLLLPDPARFYVLPWASGSAWLLAEPWFDDATPVAIDPRRALRSALAQLAEAGFGMRCGLEVEFHIYRITDERLDPAAAAWPGEPPAVQLLHPGWRLLDDGYADLAHEALAIVQHTALGLRLPLRSLEIELGPSQFEAVFDAVDALAAADQMLLFRNGVRQALRRAGYHASFVCRPPFAGAVASGWHLHQSLVDLRSGANAFCGEGAALLSATGEHFLAGLLAHARGMAALCTSTVNGYGRFVPGAMAPTSVLWGRDNRGAMLRVLGGAGDPATRIENRAGEPMANPYLCIAAQIHAGLDGIRRRLRPPPATEAPYAEGAERLPASLPEALDALAADEVLQRGFGAPLLHAYETIKRLEQSRFEQAEDPATWDRCEYFARF